MFEEPEWDFICRFKIVTVFRIRSVKQRRQMSRCVSIKERNLRLGFDFDLDSDLDILIAGWRWVWHFGFISRARTRTRHLAY